MSNLMTRGVAHAASNRLAPLFGRQLVLLAILAVGFWVLRDKIPTLDFTRIWLVIHQVSPFQWVIALLATICSFWAVGRYDQVLHSLMDTGASNNQAQVSGASAIAVAQFAGFGVLSSALVRWRLLPDMSLPAALRLSLAVSLSFLAGWAVVTALTILATGFQGHNLHFLALAVLFVFATITVITSWQPRFLPPMPGVLAIFSVVILAFIDTFFAGVALYVLLPANIDLSLAVLLPAFLIASGCGLIGGTPGGVGPFEIALLALLPTVPDEPLLGAALAFRIVYYVVPAGLALLVLLRGPLPGPAHPLPSVSPPAPSPFLSPSLERELWNARRAEVNLFRQGTLRILTNRGAATGLISTIGQSKVMLADPILPGRNTKNVLQLLHRRARQEMRAAFVYKCSARTAQTARSMGWSVIVVAQEAWLKPEDFDTKGAKYRQLRRLLRKAEKADIRITGNMNKLPLADMARISQQWSQIHGGERGFSMGQFEADYVSCQRVFLAYQGDNLVAFATFHEVQQEWTLDLMRQSCAAPDGTMHLLIEHAIKKAAALSLPRLSLAAVPCAKTTESQPVALLRSHLFKSSGAGGLRRFKSSFAPQWEPLYAAAPNRISLFLGLKAVFSSVNRPRRRP